MQRWPFGPYPPGGLTRLSEHVIAYHADASPMANSAIVQGSQATLVFDANVVRFARTLRAAVDAAGGPPLSHLVLSHIHADHSYGARDFVPPAQAWSTRYTRDRLLYWSGRALTEQAAEYREYDPVFEAEILATRLVVPVRVVETPTTIDLGGGVHVQLRIEEDAHTPADLWALVEPDGVALCGDLWFNGAEPYLGSGSLAGSLLALRHLRDAGARVYLPGHGPAGRLPGAAVDQMERLIVWLQDRVAEGMARGLRGEGLRATIRRSFDEQAVSPGGIDFTVRLPGFLEDSVETAEADLASQR